MDDQHLSFLSPLSPEYKVPTKEVYISKIILDPEGSSLLIEKLV